ncbi:site-specific integrase [Variovorax boronicumulans]|uniref:site-specific integrase n=1 Tax=Variovorax boronicumulans TaxID=436515 RepID=UPI00214B4118
MSDLMALKKLPVLDPGQISSLTASAVQELLEEGESANTVATYRSALKYWAAWFSVRYGRKLELPVAVPVVIQFLVDHIERSTPRGLVTQLPPAADQALVAGRYKAALGPLALATVTHRIAVLSKAHQTAGAPNPCAAEAVRDLVAKSRRAYARRGVVQHKQRALTKEPLQAMLATCDDSLKGLRDKALLLFAWSSGGRRRSEVAAADMAHLERIGQDTYVYTLSFSKTNQSGADRAENAKPIAGRAGQAMTAWLQASGIEEGRIFRQVRRGGHLGEALGDGSVRDIVKARCLAAGLEGDFSAHSLRAGFVTEAGRQQVPLADTMAMTGHRGVGSVLGYFRTEALAQAAVSKLID